eukprot:TRINITY_DN37134_c0_g1_i1.p1 TRINITY_DN37134_c0_g1~~TRINITY_DN37134_c0_g1_i1.p1  ORF type:complete len:264 (-),score=47.67 TRINITY_DN37134_c0_g1_i1:41-832(-)
MASASPSTEVGGTSDSNAKNESESSQKGNASIHNCDQRSPAIELCHETLPRPLRLEQRGADSPGFVVGTSSVMWPVATIVAKNLCSRPEIVKGLDCIELGAGIGILGAAAAALGAKKSVVTDWTGALPLLERNKTKLAEDGYEIDVAVIEWGTAEHHAAVLEGFGCPSGFDVVLATDVVMPGFDTDKLLESIVALAKKSPETKVIIGYEFREEWETVGTFIGWAEEAGFECTHQPLLADGSIDDSDDPDGDFLLYTLQWKNLK